MILAIISGLIIGAIAKLIMPGKDPGGWIVTIILGIAGSWFAHFTGEQMNFYSGDEPVGFIASVLGAVGLLAIYRYILANKKNI